MKITFILPAIGKKKNEKYIGTWKMEPLTIAVLKSLTPDSVETAFYDDRIELIDYDAPTDLVAITVETYTARRAYAIAEQFSSRGVHVVMGGYHVTLFPEEAMRHAGTIVTGNAESCWAAMLEDFRRGRARSRYDGSRDFAAGSAANGFPLPDKSIFQGKKYLPVALVETGRGCVHSCNFCAISSFYGRRYCGRDIRSVCLDIERARSRYYFLADDNLIADRKNAMRLFEAIAPYRIKWAGQGTLTMASDGELLRAMKKSGCELILTGFESLETQSLRQMDKGFMTGLATDEAVKRI
ncbi:MAG: radical SAM protein, partial [Gracilibacteraceae bacterium]|nr:radical SAM protein [Gracilibacteraceae bacterium]